MIERGLWDARKDRRGGNLPISCALPLQQSLQQIPSIELRPPAAQSELPGQFPSRWVNVARPDWGATLAPLLEAGSPRRNHIWAAVVVLKLDHHALIQ